MLLYPGDSPRKNTGVDCHALLWGASQPRDQTCSLCIAGRFLPLSHWGSPLKIWKASQIWATPCKSHSKCLPTNLPKPLPAVTTVTARRQFHFPYSTTSLTLWLPFCLHILGWFLIKPLRLMPQSLTFRCPPGYHFPFLGSSFPQLYTQPYGTCPALVWSNLTPSDQESEMGVANNCWNFSRWGTI